jgi:hypothetical protein
LYETLGSKKMAGRSDHIHFDLDFSPLSLMSKGLYQRCECEGDEWGLEGQFCCEGLFYGEDGRGHPVRDSDDLHLLYLSLSEEELVEGSEIGVHRVSSHCPVPSHSESLSCQIGRKPFLSGCFEFGGSQEADVKREGV